MICDTNVIKTCAAVQFLLKNHTRPRAVEIKIPIKICFFKAASLVLKVFIHAHIHTKHMIISVLILSVID